MRAVYRVINPFDGNDASFSEQSLLAPESHVTNATLGLIDCTKALMPPAVHYQAMHSLTKEQLLTFSKTRRET